MRASCVSAPEPGSVSEAEIVVGDGAERSTTTGVGIWGEEVEVDVEEAARSSPTVRTRLMMECRSGWDADLRVSCALMSCDMRVAVFVSSSYGTGTYAAMGNWDVSVDQ